MKLTPAAATSTMMSLSPPIGSDTSEETRTSGPPVWDTTIARTDHLSLGDPRIRRCGLRVEGPNCCFGLGGGARCKGNPCGMRGRVGIHCTECSAHRINSARCDTHGVDP